MRIPVADRLLAVVGYLPFLFWVPVVLKRDSMFCQFHGRQGGVLWALWFVPVFLMLVVSVFVPDLTVGSVGPFYFGAMMVLTGIYLLLVLVGVLKALLRERYRMPIVADLALKMGL
ncbi:MAG: hypothetical protein QOD77_960 [Thermoplasmata archaeon]|jgi:uncharacterized membrane protein|nr:hypothetical protein [Thermoplasmata archaeon]